MPQQPRPGAWTSPLRKPATPWRSTSISCRYSKRSSCTTKEATGENGNDGGTARVASGLLRRSGKGPIKESREASLLSRARTMGKARGKASRVHLQTGPLTTGLPGTPLPCQWPSEAVYHVMTAEKLFVLASGQCKEAPVGGRCAKGRHVCCFPGCFGKHPFTEHKGKTPKA